MADISLKDIRELVEQGNSENRIDNGVPFLVIPEGYRLMDVENTLQYPVRKKGNPQFTRSGSFTDYVNEQKLLESRIYVTSATQLVAVLDHHQPDDDKSSPGWGQHRATLNLTKSPEWLTWTKANNTRMMQREFAQFVEDNADEVARPSSNELLDLIRTIKASSNCVCTGQVDEKAGNEQRAFFIETKTTAGVKGELELPSEITLALSVYGGEKPAPIQARLRFDAPQGGKIVLWYELVRVQRFEQKSLEEIIGDIEGATELSAWYGTP
jgi:uncharacterized protein YfdQ (DUF2303 family)